MNIANKLTVLRIVLTFVLMGFLFVSGLTAKIVALCIFLFAGLTDFFDGWLARTRDEMSDFGRLMDPVADKVLVLGAFLAFVELGLIASWMVIIIIIRELLITGLRLFALHRGVVLEAGLAGKHKTVSQMGTIFVILVVLVVKEVGIRQGFWTSAMENYTQYGIFTCMGITVGLTVFSGFLYLWSNRKIIKSI